MYDKDMTSAAKHQKKFNALLADYSNLLSEIYPFRNSFHAFLLEHDVHAWAVYSVTSDKSTPEVYKYNLSMNPMTEQGYRFVLGSQYVEEAGGPDFSFTVPFTYIEDPQGWVDSLWNRITEEQAFANEAYERISPGLREDLGLHVKISHSVNGDLYCMVEHKDGTRIYRNDPIRPLIKARKFIVNIATGEISGIM
jgi:hypothetical protein